MSHLSMAAISVSLGGEVITLTSTGRADGRVLVPSKCPQKPLAWIASSKWTEKMAHLRPLASSLGMEDGNESDSEVVVTDVLGRFVYEFILFV